MAMIGLVTEAAPEGFILRATLAEMTAAAVEMTPAVIPIMRSLLPLVTAMVVTPDGAAPSLLTWSGSKASLVTAVIPAIAVAALTITLALSFNARTATVAARLTGCVACQKVPDTGTVPLMLAVTVPETGCVACQNVPVTGVDGIDAIETGWVAG